MATVAKRSKVEYVVGSSWAALVAEDDPQRRKIGTLVCTEQRERGEGPLATQPDREIKLNQTNRGAAESCVGVVARVQSKLSRALHAHRERMLLQVLQTLKSAAMN